MKKIIVATFVALVAVTTLAATTWTPVSTGSSHVRAVKATTTVATGTEPSPVTSTATIEGLNLVGLGGFGVLARTVSGNAMTVGGVFRAHEWNKDTGEWHRVPTLDFGPSTAVSTLASGGYEVVADFGRIQFVPDGIGTPVVIHYYGTSTTGGPPRTR